MCRRAWAPTLRILADRRGRQADDLRTEIHWANEDLRGDPVPSARDPLGPFRRQMMTRVRVSATRAGRSSPLISTVIIRLMRC